MDKEEKKRIDDRIKAKCMFKEFATLVGKEFNIHPIIMGEVALTNYSFLYELKKVQIEFLIEEEYCSGKKKEEWLQFLISNNYEVLENNQFQKDGILFFYDGLEKYNIDKNKCKRHISSFRFERIEDKIKWETKPKLEYYILPFSIFKKIYRLRKDKEMIELIDKAEKKFEKEKKEEIIWHENSEIRHKIHNYLVTEHKNSIEFLTDLSVQYKRTKQEIEKMFIEYKTFLEKEQKRQEQKNWDILEIVHGCSERGALETTCFKNNKSIDISEEFCIGPLDNTREKWLNEYYGEFYEENKERKKEFNRLVKNAKRLRIWSSKKEINEYLMLLYLCSILPDDKEIYVTFADSENFISIGYLTGKEIENIAKKEHKLTKEEKENYKKEWNKIVEENGDIRFFENEKIKSVSFNYLDKPLLELLNETKAISCVEFVGDLMANYFLDTAGDYEYKYLVERLINQGKIEIISDGIEFKILSRESNFYKIIKVKE